MVNRDARDEVAERALAAAVARLSRAVQAASTLDVRRFRDCLRRVDAALHTDNERIAEELE